MTIDGLEVTNATKALAYRLSAWGVTDDPAAKARSFINDLTRRGWKPSFELTARRPPRREEECRTHPGEYAPPNCRACWSDRKAQRDEADNADRAQVRRTAQEAIAEARAQLRAATTEEET